MTLGTYHIALIMSIKLNSVMKQEFQMASRARTPLPTLRYEPRSGKTAFNTCVEIFSTAFIMRYTP